ncbi:MAG: hypothetical protein ABH821_03560 [archaeon]
MIELIAFILIFLAGFLVTFLVTPKLIKRFHAKNLNGKDMNKFEKPLVAELGGIPVIFGFAFAIMIAIGFFTYTPFNNIELVVLLAGFTTMLLIGFIGVVDDLIGWKKGIRQWQHALFPVFAALPLMALNVGSKIMVFPFIGEVNFGIVYSLILIPFGVSAAANAFNLLAGFNGLEIGMGVITSVTLLVIALLLGRIEVVILLAAWLGALIGIFYFNWFPTKIFVGDAVTLMNGAMLASAAIIGNMEKVGIALIALLFIELIFKARHKFQSECFGIPQKDGTLRPRPEGGSFTHWVMRRGNFTEKQVVLIILSIHAVISFAVGFSFLMGWF